MADADPRIDTATAEPLVIDTAPEKTRRRWLRPLLMFGVPLVILAIAGYFWATSGRYVSTDNAYVSQDKVSVASDVAGRGSRPLASAKPSNASLISPSCLCVSAVF